jgi:hypothetical protein
MNSLADFSTQERRRAIRWKYETSTLPELAKVPAPYVGKDGTASGTAHDFCLPAEFAKFSLLPEVRESVIALFAELGIAWHAAIGDGPSNHLLSSQVQCVNALGQMVAGPDRIIRAFGPVLGTEQVEQIEPGRWLTFEYIGAHDHLNEAVDGVRVRGSRCTSVDAAFLHRTSEGLRELVLVEWKYTEHYGPRTVVAAKDAVRYDRYGRMLAAADSPVIDGVLPFAALLQEPIYQLTRQQLLAHELEKAHAHGADRVRVVHVMPAGNRSYHESLHGAEARALGATVKDVWQSLLRCPDRFVSIDSALFLDEKITSKQYVQRYGETSESQIGAFNSGGFGVVARE